MESKKFEDCQRILHAREPHFPSSSNFLATAAKPSRLHADLSPRRCPPRFRARRRADLQDPPHGGSGVGLYMDACRRFGTKVTKSWGAGAGDFQKRLPQTSSQSCGFVLELLELEIRGQTACLACKVRRLWMQHDAVSDGRWQNLTTLSCLAV